MLSFTTSPATHAVVSKASRIFFSLAFLVGITVLAAGAIRGYLAATAILKDHSVVTAPVTLDEVVEERGRKGRKRNMYHFSYRFEAKGQPQTGTFITSESNADPYLEDGVTVEVAYSNQEPSRFDRLERLQNQSSLKGVIIRLLVSLPFVALLAWIAHLLTTRKLFVLRT